MIMNNMYKQQKQPCVMWLLRGGGGMVVFLHSFFYRLDIDFTARGRSQNFPETDGKACKALFFARLPAF